MCLPQSVLASKQSPGEAKSTSQKTHSPNVGMLPPGKSHTATLPTKPNPTGEPPGETVLPQEILFQLSPHVRVGGQGFSRQASATTDPLGMFIPQRPGHCKHLKTYLKGLKPPGIIYLRRDLLPSPLPFPGNA